MYTGKRPTKTKRDLLKKRPDIELIEEIVLLDLKLAYLRSEETKL